MSASQQHVHLTFDVDWVCDEILQDTLDLLASTGAGQATFFVTHSTPLLETMRGAGIEMGAHPNFLPLFRGGAVGSADAVMDEMKRIVPEARVVRCHGLVRGGVLSQLFIRRGFTHESNLFIPAQTGIAAQPYEAPPGLVQLIHNWGDYACLAARSFPNPDAYLSSPGLKIVNFHPLHLYLNTTSLEQYEKGRDLVRDAAALRALRMPGEKGVRDHFVELVRTARRRGLRFGRLDELRP